MFFKFLIYNGQCENYFYLSLFQTYLETKKLLKIRLV